MNQKIYMDAIKEYEKKTLIFCHDDQYLRKVALPWFRTIAPRRSVEHGFEGLMRFGARGVFAQIINKYYRWKQSPGHLDTYQDAFGYGVIMGVVLHWSADELKWVDIFDGHSPHYLFEKMVADAWEENRSDLYVAEMAIGLAFAMWNEGAEFIWPKGSA